MRLPVLALPLLAACMAVPPGPGCGCVIPTEPNGTVTLRLDGAPVNGWGEPGPTVAAYGEFFGEELSLTASTLTARARFASASATAQDITLYTSDLSDPEADSARYVGAEEVAVTVTSATETAEGWQVRGRIVGQVCRDDLEGDILPCAALSGRFDLTLPEAPPLGLSI